MTNLALPSGEPGSIIAAYGLDPSQTALATMIAQRATPLLRAVSDLGPERVQYIPGPVPRRRLGEPIYWTCWSLDGRRASDRTMLAAAQEG